MIIIANPARQILIKVAQEIDSQFLMEDIAVWFKDLYPTIKQLRAKYPEIDEIRLFGPNAYIENIAQDLSVIFENDDELHIVIVVNE